ncbi:MAG: Rab family GTPase [Hyphomicrobiaceae bacterium]|nr:Rab family GTPase [Hyphomicrobiaceae bacterium]
MITRKILLLGEIGVGKTSLVRRFVLDELPTDYQATMGVDLYRYELKGLGPAKDRAIELVIWDTDGSYGHSIFSHVYAKGASGALIVGDVTRPTTLEHMAALAEAFTDAMPSRHFSLVLNKVDLTPPDDKLLPEPIRRSRQPKVWTSAMTAENVNVAFRETADAIVRREC